MAKVSLRIEEAYERKGERERFEQLRQEQETKKQQRQAIFAALAEKKNQARLTVEDLDVKLDVIIEMLQDLCDRTRF